jgi:hypothetical protein
MDLALYILLKPTVFVLPVSPGGTAIYSQFAAPAQMKMIDNIFCKEQELLLIVHEHQLCMLPHAQ